MFKIVDKDKMKELKKLKENYNQKNKLKTLAFPSLASLTLAACAGGHGGRHQSTYNTIPIPARDKTLSMDEDTADTALNINAPTDADGDSLTITVTAVPSGGTLATAEGTTVTGGSSLSISQLTGLVFTPDANLNDDNTAFGAFTYSVSDGKISNTGTVTISVTPVNDAPELPNPDLAIDENHAAVVAMETTDVDGDTLTYETTGGEDQALFGIDSSTGTLSFINRPDYESPQDSDQNNSYLVEVTVTDPSGLTDTETFTITVNDVTTHVAITNTVIDENDAGAIIGTLSAAIDDINATHEYTYTLSGTDASSFEVVDGQLKLKDGIAANYEVQNSYSVTVTATDTGGLSTSQDFTVTINDINDAPTAINLTGSLYVNDNDTGAVVGELTTTDKDAGDSHTYSLSGTDASLFEMIDGKLKLKDNVTPVNATQSTYSVTVTSTDKGGASINQTYTVEVNIAPTDLALGSYAVDENYVGSAVGTISTTDSNTNDEFTYSLSGTDAASFEIDSGQLMVKSGTWLDYETKSTYSVTITVTDQGGLTFDKTVTINVNDVDYGNPWVNEHVSVFDMPISDDIGIRGQQWVSSWADGSQQEMPFSIKFEHDNDPNTPLVITYSLINTNSVLGDNYDNDTEGIVEPYYNIKDYSAEWEAAVDKAFEYWGNVSGITFIKVEDNANMCGDIRIALASDFGGLFGWSNVPCVYQGENNSAANDIWIKSYYDQWDGSWPAYNHWFLIHEIGHSLGLAHPHEDYYSTVEQNTAVYTVMSYIGWAYIQNPWPGYEVGDELFIDQLGINDIKTIQYLYGMTPNFNNGNTVYTYTGPIYTTIYDTDGIDTIDVSSYGLDITLDLRGGMVSYIGTAELELEVPYGNGAYEYNHEYSGFPIGIAENTVIENAISGSGNDSITCNVAVNYIACGAGDDNVFNIGPGDYIFGGDGSDSFWIISLDFASIRGGVGANVFNGEGDMLVFDDYAGSTIDLRSFTDAQLTSIEGIDIEDDSATTLKISYQALLDLECDYTRDMDGDGDQDYVIYIHADSTLDQIQIDDEGWSVKIPINNDDNVFEGYDYYSSADGEVWFAFTTGTSVILNPDGNNYPAKTSTLTAPGDIEKTVVTPVDEEIPITTPDENCRPAENNQTQSDVGNSDYIAPDVSALPYWSLLVEEFDLGPITLPETVLTSVDDALPDLSDLVGLLGDQDESLALDFAQVDVDAPVVASIGSVKPVTKDWTSQADPFIDSDWNPIIEELYYSSEFG